VKTKIRLNYQDLIYLTNFQRVVIPSLLNELFVKLSIPIIILLAVYSTLPKEFLKLLYVAVNGIALIGLLFYTYKLGALLLKIDWVFINKKRVKEMSEYALFGILGALSSTIAFRIDTIMVAGFTDYTKTGIYSLALYIASILLIPSLSIIPLVGAQISKLQDEKSIPDIGILYKKTSLILLTIGCGLFLLIWSNIDDLFLLTQRSDELMTGKMVVLYLGIAKIIDMTFSVNGPIIAYGKYYRWNFIFILLMAILTISTNIYFIPKIGFVGAAIATLISLSLFNFIKFSFVYIVYRIQPFVKETAWVLLMSVSCLLLVDLLPTLNSPIGNILLRSVAISALYFYPIYHFKISEDLNVQVDRIFSKLMSFISRN